MTKPIYHFTKHPNCFKLMVSCMFLSLVLVVLMGGSSEFGAYCKPGIDVYPICFKVLNVMQLVLFLATTYLQCINFEIDESKVPEALRMPKTDKNGNQMSPINHTFKILVPCKRCKAVGPFTLLEFHKSQTYLWQFFFFLQTIISLFLVFNSHRLEA